MTQALSTVQPWSCWTTSKNHRREQQWFLKVPRVDLRSVYLVQSQYKELPLSIIIIQDTNITQHYHFLGYKHYKALLISGMQILDFIIIIHYHNPDTNITQHYHYPEYKYHSSLSITKIQIQTLHGVVIVRDKNITRRVLPSSSRSSLTSMLLYLPWPS